MACQRRNGFTLIEMLIAMTLLGIMVMLLFSSLKIAAESWNAGEGKIIEVNKKAVVYQFFKSHLTSIRPATAQLSEQDINDNVEPRQVFQGQSRSMRFVSALPLSSARKGLQIFDIASKTSSDASTLMVSLTPYQQIEPAQPEPVVLLENVKAFGFAYFGKIDENDELVWHDEWVGSDHLPQLIKVTIRLKDDSYWPSMIFPLKITGQVITDTAVSDTATDASDVNDVATQ